MPCVETFLKQSRDYQDSILPPSVRRRLSVEAASSDYWRKFVGIDGETIGMESFGASAPGDVLLDHFGFTANNVIKTIRTMVS
jgi:transketolase